MFITPVIELHVPSQSRLITCYGCVCEASLNNFAPVGVSLPRTYDTTANNRIYILGQTEFHPSLCFIRVFLIGAIITGSTKENNNLQYLLTANKTIWILKALLALVLTVMAIYCLVICCDNIQVKLTSLLKKQHYDLDLLVRALDREVQMLGNLLSYSFVPYL